MIRTTGKIRLCFLGLLAAISSLLSAGQFVPPADGPVPFRRDRIPLNAETMDLLSKNLCALARQNKTMDAQGLRGAAQMLALALALNPENTNAHELVTKYKENRHTPAGNDEKNNNYQARIERLISWLETPQAGPDAQALAACLSDILLYTNSQSLAARNTVELGAWNGWIANVSAYRPKANDNGIVKPKEPEPIAKQPENSGILLEKATVLTTMWRSEDNGGSRTYLSVLAPLQMTASKEAPSEDVAFSIMISNHQDSESMDSLEKMLETLLIKQHGSLPPVGQIKITSGLLDQSLQLEKPQSISAAAAVLASSAITGQAPEAIIIGKIDANGAFTLPAQFWDRLQMLGKGTGQRLVLPSDASPYLLSILAMEKPEFFFDYEVLLAADFKQLLELSSKSPGEPLATATAKFREIRERVGTKNVRDFIDISSVKQRLAAVNQDLPAHLSANMLLTQATGKRPTSVSRKVLASEIRRALEPMAWIKTSKHFVFDSEDDPPPYPRELSEVGETYEICRPLVDRLERYTSKENMDLLTEARELVIAIRTLNKAPRSRSSNSWESINIVRSAHYDVVQRQTTLAAKLNRNAEE